MMQYSLKKGLKVFGTPGPEAVYKEMKQLHDRKVCLPRSAHSLSSQQCHDALGYLMFLKGKCNGLIEGQGCADSQKQWMWTAKDDATLPTIATESILLTSVIESKEHWYIITANIVGAFMQGDQEEIVHMHLDHVLVDMLVKCDPECYAKYVTEENGKRVLYVEHIKALYGTLWATLSFWHHLTHKLLKLGFEINPMIGVLQTNGSKSHSAQSPGTWMASNYHMSKRMSLRECLDSYIMNLDTLPHW